MISMTAKKSLRRKSGGQIAIGLLFIAVIGLVFYAVTMNVGRFAQNKSVVTLASNTAASQLASYAASYAKQIVKTHLGGEYKRCGLTGAFSALIGIVLAIVGAILSPFTGGASVALCVIGIALAVASFVVEAFVVQPEITNAFRKIRWQNLAPKEAMLDESLDSALTTACDDQVGVTDYIDLDADNRFMGSLNGSQNDKIARLSVLMYKRLKDIEKKSTYNQAVVYLRKLSELLYEGEDGWGLVDKPGIQCDLPQNGGGESLASNNVPSECNPCCVADSYDGDQIKSPLCFIDPFSVLNGTCGASTPFPGYDLVFDQTYEDMWNSFRGFRELMGRDDENNAFNRRFLESVAVDANDEVIGGNGTPGEDANGNGVIDVIEEEDLDGDGFVDTNEDLNGNGQWDPPYSEDANGNGILDPGLPPGNPLPGPGYGHPDQVPQVGAFLPSFPFYFGDTTNYYKDDLRDGSYPLFWQLKHFGVDLNSLTFSKNHPEVVWCDPNYPDDCPEKKLKNMIVMNIDKQVQLENGGQFSLGARDGITDGLAPGILWDVICERNPWVDGSASGFDPDYDQTKIAKWCGPPLGVDVVNESNTPFVNLVLNPDVDIWREGANRYCSGSWPYEFDCYDMKCDEEGDCVGGKPMDKMDRIVYGLQDFAEWAMFMVNNDEISAKSLADWVSADSQGREGVLRNLQLLQRVLDAIQEVKQRLIDWREVTYKTSCATAWCVPEDPGACSSPPPPDEMATFGDGKLNDVAACLNWNIGDQSLDAKLSILRALHSCPGGNCERWVPGANGNSGYANLKGAMEAIRAAEAEEGNGFRFRRCLQECTEEACSDLPRTLVKNFNPNEGFEPDECDPEPGNDDRWANKIMQSAIEADKQDLKMTQRLEFLMTLIVRRDQLIDILEEAELRILDFLNTPLPSPEDPYAKAIYAWKDEPSEEAPYRDRWHYVKVESTLPSGKLPWMDTWTEGWFNLRRCYEIKNDTGTVRVKVSRFDEPVDKEKLKTETAKGVTIWKFLTKLPGAPDADLSGVVNACQDNFATNPDGSLVEGAFVATPKDDNTECWEKVSKIIDDHGYSSATCATYYRRPIGDNKAYSFEFKRCD